MANNLSDFLRAAALLHPRRPAMVELQPLSTQVALQLDYVELQQALDRVAASMTAKSVKPGDRLIVAMGNHIDTFLWTFGLAQIGAVPVMVNPRLRLDDLDFVIKECGAIGIIIDDQAQAPDLGAALPIRIAVRTKYDGYESAESILAFGKNAPEFAADQTAAAFVHYTSGSTGRPKGVITTHQGIARHYLDLKPYLLSMHSSPVVNMVCSPLFHTSGVGNALIAMVTMGTLVIVPKFDAKVVLRAIQDHRVTTAMLVSTMLIGMLSERELRQSLDMSSLQAVMAGAAPTGSATLDQVVRDLKVSVYQVYGSTEAGFVMGHIPGKPYTLESCGKPTPGTTCRLVDAEGSDADEGELWIKNPGWSTGYINRDETARKFKGDWYLSGDIMSRDANGYYFFRGRTDDMFVCGGENIYPVEVERVLLQHPGLRNVCVVPIPHATKVAVPVAMVERNDVSLSAEELKAFALANAPAYVHPRLIRFVDALPIAATGKIDRKAVRTMMQDVAKTAPAPVS